MFTAMPFIDSPRGVAVITGAGGMAFAIARRISSGRTLLLADYSEARPLQSQIPAGRRRSFRRSDPPRKRLRPCVRFRTRGGGAECRPRRGHCAHGRCISSNSYDEEDRRNRSAGHSARHRCLPTCDCGGRKHGMHFQYRRAIC